MKCLNIEELMNLVGTDTKVKSHPDYDCKVKPACVLEIIERDKYWEIVLVGGFVVALAENGFGYCSREPAFILADEHQSVEVFDSKKLKAENSKPNAVRCVQCNGLLKEPFPNIKFCPKCEV